MSGNQFNVKLNPKLSLKCVNLLDGQIPMNHNVSYIKVNLPMLVFMGPKGFAITQPSPEKIGWSKSQAIVNHPVGGVFTRRHNKLISDINKGCRRGPREILRTSPMHLYHHQPSSL